MIEENVGEIQNNWYREKRGKRAGASTQYPVSSRKNKTALLSAAYLVTHDDFAKSH